MSPIFSGLLQNTLVVAAICPVAWLVCRAMRTRPAAQHLVWLLLLVKLVLPPVVVWPWVVNVGSWRSSAPPAVAHVPSPSLTREADGDLAELASLDSQLAVLASEEAAIGQSASWLPTKQQWLDWTPLAIWLNGTLVVLFTLTRQLARQRAIRRDASTAAEWLVELVQHVAQRMRMRPIRTLVSARIASPMICCLGAPRLLWPNSRDDANSADASEGVVAHELAHVARRDHYVAWFEMAVSVVLWWHPLAWWLRRRLRESRELACDALAVSVVPDRRAYANLLLQLSSASNDQWVAASALGVGDASRKSLERRLIMIFNERASGRVSLSGLVVLGLLAVLCVPGWSLSDDPKVAEAVVPAVPVAPAAPVTPPVEPKAAPEAAAAPVDTTIRIYQEGNLVVMTDETEAAPPAKSESDKLASEAVVRGVRFLNANTLVVPDGGQVVLGGLDDHGTLQSQEIGLDHESLVQAIDSLVTESNETKDLGKMILDGGQTVTVQAQPGGMLLITVKSGDKESTLRVPMPQPAVPVDTTYTRVSVGQGVRVHVLRDGKVDLNSDGHADMVVTGEKVVDPTAAAPARGNVNQRASDANDFQGVMISPLATEFDPAVQARWIYEARLNDYLATLNAEVAKAEADVTANRLALEKAYRQQKEGTMSAAQLAEAKAELTAAEYRFEMAARACLVATNAQPAATVNQPDLQRELLTTDIEEAEANLSEKQLELEQAAALAAKGVESSTKVQLLKLALKKAEIELRRCQLHLKLHDRTHQVGKTLGSGK